MWPDSDKLNIKSYKRSHGFLEISMPQHRGMSGQYRVMPGHIVEVGGWVEGRSEAIGVFGGETRKLDNILNVNKDNN